MKEQDKLCACTHKLGQHARTASGPEAELACKECGCRQFRPGEPSK
jgi:hypothetical protein